MSTKTTNELEADARTDSPDPCDDCDALPDGLPCFDHFESPGAPDLSRRRPFLVLYGGA